MAVERKNLPAQLPAPAKRRLRLPCEHTRRTVRRERDDYFRSIRPLQTQTRAFAIDLAVEVKPDLELSARNGGIHRWLCRHDDCVCTRDARRERDDGCGHAQQNRERQHRWLRRSELLRRKHTRIKQAWLHYGKSKPVRNRSGIECCHDSSVSIAASQLPIDLSGSAQ